VGPCPDSRASSFRGNGATSPNAGIVARVEELVGRVLRSGKRGPKGPWKHKQRGDNWIYCPQTSHYSRGFLAECARTHGVYSSADDWCDCHREEMDIVKGTTSK